MPIGREQRESVRGLAERIGLNISESDLDMVTAQFTSQCVAGITLLAVDITSLDSSVDVSAGRNP